MTNPDRRTPLYIHTLETLCNELVSGRAVILDDEGTEFRLALPETRSIFDWYRRNRDKWAKRVQKEDVEALADQLDKEPPELPVVAVADVSRKTRKIHLRSMRVHRFAGIHWYGTPEQPPDDFEFVFEKPLTLIEGMNGAGKTSLLSAISWGLTGYVYRSQRPPETVDQSVPVEFVDDTETASGDGTSYDMAAITPLPSAEVLKSLNGKPVPLDTWVELTFVDDEGKEVDTIRRSVQRSRSNKIAVSEPDFSKLGLDPVAREVGTKLPGLIPYIRLDEASDLGKAVAALTGFKPLQNLVDHAKRSQIRLINELVKDREAEIENLDADFSKARTELEGLVEHHSDIDPGQPLPTPSPEATIEHKLQFLADHFQNLQAKALAETQSILGESFDYKDRATREDLIDNIGRALGMLDAGNLRRLSSAKRLAELLSLRDEELSQARALIEQLVTQANDLARLIEQPDVATRLRLYARIAGWMKDLPEEAHVIEDCPVCQSALEGKVDPVTGTAVAEHIRQYLEIDSEYLEKTLQAWGKSALATLASDLPDSLRSELDKDLPERPIDLISDALVEELFASPIFSRSLAPLKSTCQALCDRELDRLPPFAEPGAITFPRCFGENGGPVVQAVCRVTRAIAFARWRRKNDAACKDAFARIVGMAKPSGETAVPPREPVEDWPLYDCVVALDCMVKNATPLTEALSKVNTMNDKLLERRKKQDRIKSYKRTATAMEDLFGLSDLVDRQVAYLMQKLLSATLERKDSFYRPAFVDAPSIVNTDVRTDGSLVIDAAAGGTRASAHHISNTSDLRATLLAFLIAYWQHLLETRGGLSVLLLDDLQELFDRENRRRVANSIPSILKSGGRVVVTTNDPDFGRRAAAASVETLGFDKVDRRRIHPLKPARSHIELGQFLESIEEKQKAFEAPKNRNEHQPARDYIKDLRIYLENRLLDFFDMPDPGLPEDPTLSGLIGAVRNRTKVPQDAFTSGAFTNLVSDPALADKSPFLKLMNQSHHGNEDEISFNDVWQVKEDCVRVRKLVDATHEEYERWMRRDPRELASAMPEMPAPITPPSIDVPVILDLAAFTADVPLGDIAEAEVSFSGSWFEKRAIYFINTHNFGFSGRIDCRAIVDLTDENVADSRLAIALHRDKIYARRLLRDITKPGFVTLGSEAENPLHRPPSLLLPTEEVRLLKVVGILFDDRPLFPKPNEEAALVDESDFLEKIELAFKVRGDSALPLALPGQTILGGSRLMPSQLKEMEGSLVAVATSDGSAFKRIGKAVPAVPHVRQFEAIGGHGESLLVRIEDIEDAFADLPLFQSARHIMGVLYDLG